MASEKWLVLMLSILPKEQICKVIITVLRRLAEFTDNTLDDQIVDLIEAILNQNLNPNGGHYAGSV